MSGIARSVELFNQAFRLAWSHLSEIENQPNLSNMLGDAIHRRLIVGGTDAVQIAAEAIAEIKKGV